MEISDVRVEPEEFPQPFRHVRQYIGLDEASRSTSHQKIPAIFDSFEATLALAKLGSGELEGFRWEPSCSGNGTKYSFPELMGECGGEIIRLQEGVYLVTRTFKTNMPLSIVTREQRGLHYMFVPRGCLKLLVDGFGSTVITGPAAVIALYPESTIRNCIIMPGAPVEWITVSFREPERIHEFGFPESWKPRQLARWLELPRDSMGYSILVPSPQLVATAREIQTTEMSGPVRSLFLAAKSREFVCHLIGSRTIASDFSSSRDIHQMPNCRSSEIIKFLIEADPSYAWTIQSLADYVGVSPSKLMRDFKEQHGDTIHVFQRGTRLRRARELLATTNKSITDIALSVGYSGINNFSDAFRAVYNCAPSEMRRAVQR